MDPGIVLKNRPALLVAGILTLFTLYASFAGDGGPTTGQSSLAVIALALSAVVFLLIDSGPLKNPRYIKAVVLLTFLLVTTIAFHGTAYNIFRSDYWIILGQFTRTEGFTLQALKNISLFEMFGDVRFQPFAHILMYLRHLLLGQNVLLFHVLNILLHSIAGFAVFLLLKRILGDLRFSYALGLIFIVLPSQFDTVIWTYHIYIIVSTIFVLLAFMLSMDFTERPRPERLIAPVALAAVAVLLYEPALLVPASLFFFSAGLCTAGAVRVDRHGLIRIIIGIAIAYIIYLSITFYGLTLKETPGTTLVKISIWKHLALSVQAFFKNLWESSFVKNIGVVPKVDIDDIVYLELRRLVPIDLASVFKLVSALFLLFLARVTKTNRTVVLVLLALALSYLGIISIGRVLTNPITYVAAQPRYQYLPNALFIAAAGAALWPKYQDKRFKPVVNVVLAAIFFWNTQNVLFANARVAEAMKPVDTHYYRLKGFFKANPSSKVYLSFIPSNRRIFLGSDISMDYLFKDRTTRFVERATHVYNGYTITENRFFNPEGTGQYLGDFSIGWLHMYPARRLKKDIEIIGSAGVYPRVSITMEKGLKLELLNATTGDVDAFVFSLPNQKGPYDDWHLVTIEKSGAELCVYLNERPLGKTLLSSPYKQWEKDGPELFGEFYSGGGELFFVANLGIQLGLAKRGCWNY